MGKEKKIPDEKIKGNLRFWNLVALIIERDMPPDKPEEKKPMPSHPLNSKEK